MSDLHALVSGFADAAAVYDRGRPEYPPHAVDRLVAELGAGARPPARVLDVGAGTGKLTRPLIAAGLDVVAVEPLPGMRAALAGAVGADRVLDGRAEALPLEDASLGGAVCADAFHWFDGDRAAAELARVLRPGAVLVAIWTIHENDTWPWTPEIHRTLEPLWRAFAHPSIVGGVRGEALDRHAAFAPVRRLDVAFEDELDRDRLLAWYASFSVIGALADEERAATLARMAEIVDRYEESGRTIRRHWRADVWVTRRV